MTPKWELLPGATETTYSVEDEEWKCTFRTTFRIVPASFQVPETGDIFRTEYSELPEGRVLRAKITAIEGSPNCLLEVDWMEVPEPDEYAGPFIFPARLYL